MMGETLALIEVNWPIAAAAIVLLLAALWWLLRRGRSAPERHFEPDVLDEGVAPAARNQALIDAPPAAQIPPVIVPAPVSGAMAGLGEVIAIAAQDEVTAAAVKVAPPPPASPPTPPDEVPAPAPEPDSDPVPEFIPAPEPSPPAAPEPPTAAPDADDLARIKGLGPKLQALLPQLGLSTFAQIAALSEADLADLDGKLGAFAGRPARDGWVEQAQFLAAGDVAGFEAKFGKV
jgi:predicted flap endonuclease-1-like 5' DNA nuclease